MTAYAHCLQLGIVHDCLALDKVQKKQLALAMFAAKFLSYKKSREADDAAHSALLYKQLRRLLEEAAPLLSENTLHPDSLIWRIWHFMERESLSVREMENVRADF